MEGGWGALYYTDAELAAYLIERGAEIDVYATASLGTLEKLEALIDSDPAVINTRGLDGMTPLHFAKTPEIAALLLHHGVDINARDLEHGGTPVQWAVENRPDVCRYLIERGAEIDLFAACLLGDADVVRTVLGWSPEILTLFNAYAQRKDDSYGLKAEVG